MGAVLSGFSVIWIIIAVGYLLGRFRVLGPDSRIVLSRVVFFVASPCLLFVTISAADVRDVLGPAFLIAAITAFAMLIVYMVLARLLFRQRSFSELMVGGQGASQVNAANLGFPIAAYVLGDVALAAPVMVFQLTIYLPLLVATLDQSTMKDHDADADPGARTSTFRRVAQTAGNPVIIGALLGLLFSWQGWSFPEPIHNSIEILSGAAIPLLLISFGLSLVGNRPLDKSSGQRRDVLLAVVVKLILHPLLAWVVAAFLFGMDGLALYAAVVMASLPTAQNVLVTAVRYQTGEAMVRDTVLITTVLAIPAMIVVAALLGV